MTDDVSIVVGITGDPSGGRVIKKSLDDIATSGDKATSATKRLEVQSKATALAGDALGRAFGAAAALFGASQLVKIADGYRLLESRVKSIAGSVQETTRVMGELRKISDQTGSSMEANVAILQRLSFVRTEIKATNDEMLAFTETVTKLGIMSGAGTEALKAGLTQLGQGLSSQILRAEEFNSIMENIPGVGKAIADQFGVTTGQLRQLVVQGQVLSQDVFAAIINQNETIRQQFAEMPKTAEQGFNQMLGQVTQVVDEINKATNGTNVLGAAFRSVGTLVKRVYDGISAAFSYAVAGIGELINLILIGLNKAIEGMNALKRAAPAWTGVDKTQAELLPTVGVGSLLKEANDEATARNARLFADSTKDINVETRQISKNYAEIASKLGTSTKLTKEQREAIKAQKKIHDDLKDAVKDSRSETEKLYDKITEMERLKPYAKTAEQAEAIAKNIRNAQDELEKLRIKAELDSPVGKAFQSLAKEIDDDFKDAFKDAFTKSDGGFKKLLDGWKNAFKDFLADLAYQALVRPILVSLVGGVGGSLGLSSGAVASTLGTSGSTGGGFGGIANIGSLLSSAGNLLTGGTSSFLTSGVNKIGSLLGIGGVGANGPVSLSSFSSFTNGSFGGSLGAGLGGLGGNLLANSLFGGNRGIGSTIGGTVGAVAGSFIPVPVVGPLIGSFLGNALGGLFGGGKPTDGTQGGGVDLSTGELIGINGMGGKKYNAQNAAFRDSVLKEASELTKLFQSVGATTAGRLDVAVGSRDGLRLNTYDENGVRNFGLNSQAFIDAIMQAVVKGTTGLTGTFKAIVDKLGVGDTKKLAEAFEFGKQFDAFVSTTEKTPVDALNEALKALNDNLAALQKQAADLGLPTDKLTESYNKQKDALLGSIKAQLAGYQSLADMNKAFDNFFTGQALSANSSLTPMQKLQAAQSTFGGLLTKAQGGDLSVTPDLLSAASSLIDQGRDVYASSADFSNLEGFVRSSVQGIASQAGYSGQDVAYNIVSTNQQLVAQGNSQTQAIQDMKAELYRLSNKLASLTDKVA